MRILLIDDDADFRASLAANLRDDGHDVLEYAAASVLPPLSALGDINAVITDYDLPREDGLQFIDRYHAVHPGVPVVVVTAYSTANLEAQALRRRFVTLLRKPLQYEALLAALRPDAPVAAPLR
jgi:DNA-binding NtrC family response regulator